MLKKQLSLFLTLLLFTPSAQADEGMFLPNLLDAIYGDMKTEGMKLTQEEIYSINNSSLTDAIVHFNGGCTAEVISDKGLILTNHHCGYSQVQSHSSVENDYLKNGFWAETMEDELKNPGVTASFIERVEEVTEGVLSGVNEEMSQMQRNKVVRSNIDSIIRETIQGTDLKAVIKPFDYGNDYFMFVSKTYKDVRLVGAPPSSIGKFGGDEDNWMWPRHTGDFSLFRIYADENNEPAAPSDDNVPYEPDHSLPISLKGVDEGDFAMIYGFPGRTQHYLISDALEYIMNENDPARVEIRESMLEVIEPAMKQSDELRIKYAGKQSSISNYYKKWQGEITGLKKINALEKKKEFEEQFRKRVNAKSAYKKKYSGLISSLESAHKAQEPYDMGRDMFIEFMYYGPDFIRFINGFRDLIEQHDHIVEKGNIDSAITKQKSRVNYFFENHSVKVDKNLFQQVAATYRELMPDHLLPNVFPKVIDKKFDGDLQTYADHLFKKSAFLDKEKADNMVESLKGSPKKAQKDPAYVFVKSLYDGYYKSIRPEYERTDKRIDSLMRHYVTARKELFPDRIQWYDANSTIRISYGKVEGSTPRDGMCYRYYTTLDGVIAKHDTTEPLFTVPEKIRELHAQKDYGPYGTDGELPVCFTSSLHTSGGNSGSPIINGKGHLIGLNFDRSWESVMSDLVYDSSRCRNISVDVRYVLFLVDKVAGMDRLIEEMELVKKE